jgi:hypothetical protein
MRRTLNYGHVRMESLTLPLSELVVNYFDKNCCFDYLDMDFATKLSRDACVSPCTLVAAFIYMERLKSTQFQEFQASTASELYLSALILATKMNNDPGLLEYCYNDEFAISASTSLKRVNELELKLLDNLNWQLVISSEEYEKALHEMEHWIAGHTLDANGFATYNELNVLEKHFRSELYGHLKRLFSIVLALTAAYIAVLSSIVLCATIIATSGTTMDATNETATTPMDVIPQLLPQLYGEMARIATAGTTMDATATTPMEVIPQLLPQLYGEIAHLVAENHSMTSIFPRASLPPSFTCSMFSLATSG